MDDVEQISSRVAHLVRRMQAATGFGDRARCDAGRHVEAHDAAKRHAGDILHRHVERAVLLAEVVHGGDARMVDAAQDLRLVEEHRANGLGRRVLRQDRLDRDELLERAWSLAPAEEHGAHAAALELVQDLVGAELHRT